MTTQSSGPKGLFITSLVENTFGVQWRTVVSGCPQEVELAGRWNSPQLLDPRVVTEVRKQFLCSGDRIHHACLSGALHQEAALALHASLDEAVFVPHHHAPYPLWIAPRDQQPDTPLTHFIDWLGTQEAARYHQWLVGWPHPSPTSFVIQVQLSRMQVGHSFPLHIDTQKEGIAVVYQLSFPWEPEWGGVLSFHHPQTQQAELRIPPQFNSVMIFRPQHAPHQVSEVQAEAGDHARYSVTAFYMNQAA